MAEMERREEEVELGLGWVQRYKKTWILPNALPELQHFQHHYSPQLGDLLLASLPKTGTTWTMVLLHSVLSMFTSQPASISISETNAEKTQLQHLQNWHVVEDETWNKHLHAMVPLVEYSIPGDEVARWTDLVPPRLFHTHLPFECMPELLRESPLCRIVYVLRNPRDSFVSHFKFSDRLAQAGLVQYYCPDMSVEASLDSYCNGVFWDGPFPDHVLSYWRERERNPDRVLWLTYEQLQKDCHGCVLRMGRFLGCPNDLVRANAAAIVKKCSFQSLANADVNKRGIIGRSTPVSSFFRQGKSGSWRKHFNENMEQRIHTYIEAPLAEHGIHFSYNYDDSNDFDQ